jgi:hypothetical protein
MRIEEEVETFNDLRFRDGFRDNFATVIGVTPPEAVTIEVKAGSVLVTAFIQAQNQSEYDRIESLLSTISESDLSRELDVTVIKENGPFDQLFEEYFYTAAVIVASALLSLGLSLWIKTFVNKRFQMMQTVDIALAASDFGSDVLFVINAFSMAAELNNPSADAAGSLEWASLIFLLLSGVMSFFACLMVVLYYWTRRRSHLSTFIEWRLVKEHSNLYGVLSVLAIADVELIKLYPWRTHTYDGFPQMRVAVVVTCISLLEDVPQLIVQIIFVSTVEPSVIAAVSIAVTVMSICWRVAKRSLRLMGVAAMELLADEDKAPTTPITPATTQVDATVEAEVKPETTAPAHEHERVVYEDERVV